MRTEHEFVIGASSELRVRFRTNDCLFDSGTSLSTIFQSYRDGVWIWQGAQCSLFFRVLPH